MTRNHKGGNVKYLSRLLVLAALMAAAFSTQACVAAYGYEQHGPGYYGDVRRVAYDNGYQRGLANGQRDARDGRRADFRDDREYRDADWGYDRRVGSRGQYRQVFRDGYQAGYVEGYRRFADAGRYGEGRAVPRYTEPPRDERYGRYGTNDVAFRNGFEDGREKGAKDARSRRSFDPMRHDWFRDGDRHYDGRYGSKQQYREIYRDGFRQGYEAGYRNR